jgi:GMC oxidoreductase
MQQVEEEGGQRLRGASRRDVDAAILPAPTRPPPEPRCGRMGPSDDDVVDDRLRLRGVESLRIVDCSIMPTMISGNLNGPIMAMAWRAADTILDGQR